MYTVKANDVIVKVPTLIPGDNQINVYIHSDKITIGFK